MGSDDGDALGRLEVGFEVVGPALGLDDGNDVDGITVGAKLGVVVGLHVMGELVVGAAVIA